MEEYIDIVDDKGNSTGERRLKSLVHKNGDRHKTVHVWMMNPHGALLIQRRSPLKENNPNLWDVSYAGHISAGETSLAAAIREGKEELNLVVRESDLEYLFTVENPLMILNGGSYIDYEFQDVYLLRTQNDSLEFKLQTEEVAEVKWISWKELEALVKKGDETFVRHSREYAKLFDILGASD